MNLENKLTAMTKSLGASFTLKGRPISYAEIFSDTGLLPGLTKRAEELASLCLGYRLGATYPNEEKSLLGAKVVFDSIIPDVIRLFCLLDVVNELIKNSPTKEAVSLDELMYD